MRRLLPILLACALLLTGCAVEEQVENQAFALTLGVEHTQDGRLRLTAQVPSYSEVDGEYLCYAGEGADFPAALTALTEAVPRTLRLGQLRTIVVCLDTARRADFPALLRQMVLCEQLYTAADVILCEGNAGGFVRAQAPKIGARLSTALRAELAHDQSLGVAPRCTLADLYYASESALSDPAAPLAFREEGGENRYEGAGLFRAGVLAGTLDGREAQLLGLMRGSVTVLSLPFGEAGTVILRRTGTPRVRVETLPDAPRITLSLRLAATAPGPLDARALEQTLAAQCRALIGRCQEMGAEPFGFADRAALRFPTPEAFEAYGWHARFPSAQVELRLTLRAQAP